MLGMMALPPPTRLPARPPPPALHGAPAPKIHIDPFFTSPEGVWRCVCECNTAPGNSLTAHFLGATGAGPGLQPTGPAGGSGTSGPAAGTSPPGVSGAFGASSGGTPSYSGAAGAGAILAAAAASSAPGTGGPASTDGSAAGTLTPMVTDPPPTHATRIALAKVRLGSPKDNGRRGAHASETLSPASINSYAPLPSEDLNGDDASGAVGAAAADNGSQPLPPPPVPQPVQKRKALSATFSLPTIATLASSSASGSAMSGTDSHGNLSLRPKTPFKGTSSTFVRAWEGLPLSQNTWKQLAEQNAGRETTFGFYNAGKTVVWCDIAEGKPRNALARITFSSFPTCITIHNPTATADRIDVLVGFESGDIIWWDPITARYTRLNKAGVISGSPVTAIHWRPSFATDTAGLPVPAVPHIFLTSHADGCVLVWDKDREDTTAFVAPPPPPEDPSTTSPRAKATESPDGATLLPAHAMDMMVTRPNLPPVTENTKKRGSAAVAANPVSHWRVSRKAVTAFCFSPDAQFCAIVGQDGCLRIVDLVAEKLLDIFEGYFGALKCVAWSPDGRFVITGGQDDLCTVYAPLEQHLVARCVGHTSFITGLGWDPWHSDLRTARFASVGEDGKLILWDLSSAALMRPKAHGHAGRHHHHNAHEGRGHQHSSSMSLPRKQSTASGMEPEDRPVYFHPSPARADVSFLQPVMIKTVSADLLSDLAFLPDTCLTLSRSGQIKLWARPGYSDSDSDGIREENMQDIDVR